MGRDSLLLTWDEATDASTRTGRAAVRVPADLASFEPRAQHLLRDRLPRLTDCRSVSLVAEPEPSVLFAGLSREDLTPALRQTVEAVIADVLLDCAWSDRNSTHLR